MSDRSTHQGDEPLHDDEGQFESDEYVSKSELKRLSAERQKLGETIVGLSAAHLDTIPLDDDLSDAIAIARRINRKKDGYRRQLQFIGKLMRQRDVTDIEQALDKLVNKHNSENAAFHRLEKARESIIDGGDKAIQSLIESHPDLDRQKLRQYQRAIKREREKNAPPKAFRELFQYLKETVGEDI